MEYYDFIIIKNLNNKVITLMISWLSIINTLKKYETRSTISKYLFVKKDTLFIIYTHILFYNLSTENKQEGCHT